MVQHCALPSSALHCTLYIIGGCRVLFYILNVKIEGAAEFWSKINIVQDWALSSCASQSKWYRYGCCRILLDNLHGIDVGAVEFC